MRLVDVAISSFVYGAQAGPDDAYVIFRRAVGLEMDLRQSSHREHLFRWLNQWGCRQFMLAYHKHVGADLVCWWESEQSRLPANGTRLLDLAPSAIIDIQPAFDALAEIQACKKANGRHASVGSVGAAKILFALRPEALPPWDNPVRNHLGRHADVRSYSDYVRHVRDALLSLRDECNRQGFDICDLPSRLGRTDATLPKLVDEYYWQAVTRKLRVPSAATIKDWADWSGV